MILFLLWSWDESTAHEYRLLCYGTRTFQAASTLWMQLHPAQHFWKQERSQEGFLLLITEQLGTGGTEKKKYRRHNSIISNCWFYSFLKCHFLDGCSCFLRGAVLCQGRGCIFGGVCPCTLETPSSILNMQTEPTAQPTACSQTCDGYSTNPADFPEHQGLLKTSAPESWAKPLPGCSQQCPKALSKTMPCYPPSQSLPDRELQSHRNGHI